MNLARGHLPKPVVGCVFLIFLASCTSRDEVHRLGKPRFGGRNSGSDVSNPEWEWNCGTGNHRGTELASLGAGSSVPAGLCPVWECSFPGSWDRDI